ncbi:MAG: aspartyl protease family protein [Chitinophagaceae bacterium]
MQLLVTLFLWVFSFLPSKLIAQEEFVPPPAKHLTNIPFEMLTGGIIIVQAKLDGFPDSLNFVMDTGSGGISLDSATCALLHLKTEKSDRIIRGIAGMRTVEFTYNHSLHFPGLEVDKLDFHINDYDLLTSVYGIRIDGIIGYSFFRRYIVSIDYEKMKIEIFTPGLYKYARGGYLLHPQFSTLPMQDLRIKDDKQIEDKFYFDTGAGLCMLLSQDLVDDSLLFKKNKRIYTTEAEGLGGKKIMNLTILKELRLGPYRFKKIPIYIFRDEYNVTSYPLLGGLIGNDILRRFNVVLNYPDQQIFIKPNNRFTDSFDYSYTGLGIYLLNGVITVEDVMPNSPSAKAGFKEGDVVMAVENNLSGNLQEYKLLLQNAKATVKVLIMRNGKPQIIYMKVASIL